MKTQKAMKGAQKKAMKSKKAMKKAVKKGKSRSGQRKPASKEVKYADVRPLGPHLTFPCFRSGTEIPWQAFALPAFQVFTPGSI